MEERSWWKSTKFAVAFCLLLFLFLGIGVALAVVLASSIAILGG